MVSERFSAYLVTPAVEITILRRIGVHGEVRAPTLYWVDLTMSVRDAIALAGGLTPSGDTKKIAVRRGAEEVTFSEAESSAALAAGLESGDQIVVGRRSWFALNTPFVISTFVSVTSIFVGVLIAKCSERSPPPTPSTFGMSSRRCDEVHAGSRVVSWSDSPRQLSSIRQATVTKPRQRSFCRIGARGGSALSASR